MGLPEKCPKSVWKVSCAGVAQEKCPERKLRKRRKEKKKKENEKRKKKATSKNKIKQKRKNCRKMFKKCPNMPFGASWQPPRKMSQKCLESVLCWGCAGKMSGTKAKEKKKRKKEKRKKEKKEKKKKGKKKAKKK